ncbi:hypothetical protein P4H42_03720 [Paenibacillus macerans]|uniref:hypothetical protein n=1 Tax=Paenibacillus macerans TaxID=44252 RepID=UPI002DBBB182|nr:hypothetical protein [Paenibacillus macerans]MEC0328731.1 hypothetical protein [Paenibacillus macerans]
MPGTINVPQCPECGEEYESRYCPKCRRYTQMVTREKRQVSGKFTVVDWFSSRSSAGLIVEDAEGKRYPLYMSDVFAFLNGVDLGSLTLEETKKGSAYGWKVITKEGA